MIVGSDSDPANTANFNYEQNSIHECNGGKVTARPRIYARASSHAFLRQGVNKGHRRGSLGFFPEGKSDCANNSLNNSAKMLISSENNVFRKFPFYTKFKIFVYFIKKFLVHNVNGFLKGPIFLFCRMVEHFFLTLQGF